MSSLRPMDTAPGGAGSGTPRIQPCLVRRGSAGLASTGPSPALFQGAIATPSRWTREPINARGLIGVFPSRDRWRRGMLECPSQGDGRLLVQHWGHGPSICAPRGVRALLKRWPRCAVRGGQGLMNPSDASRRRDLARGRGVFSDHPSDDQAQHPTRVTAVPPGRALPGMPGTSCLRAGTGDWPEPGTPRVSGGNLAEASSRPRRAGLR
jgi:hypothetical protein